MTTTETTLTILIPVPDAKFLEISQVWADLLGFAQDPS